MSNELANSLSLHSEKALLNPQINANTDTMNAHLQTQWDIVRDGLWQGVNERAGQSRDNLLSTGIEAASSAGIAGCLVKAFAAGGKWKLGAEMAGAAFGAITTIDLFRRGSAIHEVYANSNSDSVGNALRANAIAQYAGAGIFDYSLILASAGLGMGAGLQQKSGMSVMVPGDAAFGKAAGSAGRIRELETGSQTSSLNAELKLNQTPTNLGYSNEAPSVIERMQKEQPQARLTELMDIDKVTDDLAFALDYQISETAMSKISQTLQQANHEEFNGILRKLEEKDRKFQGMDLNLGTWDDATQRWDEVKLHYTDETLVTHLVVQRGDTPASIADKETSVNPRRTDKDIKDYITALINKNHITDPSTLSL
jgi:hypothetical protein